MPHTLSQQKIDTLNESLHYCKMKELQQLCQKLSIPHDGKKPHLIASIIGFAQSGTVPLKTKIPLPSCKVPGKSYPLSPNTQMVYGDFKNDFATRVFLKEIIGNHFHYTVFGLDWIKNRWIAGTPPTYAEFADFWQNEYLKRKGRPQELKPEWAYLHFARTFKENNPTASKSLLLSSWKEVQAQHYNNALELLKKLIKHL